MIPMVNLKAQYAKLQPEIESGLKQVLESCAFILGPNVQAFEQEAADYLGVNHAIAVASGTEALHLALIAAGIGPGDEVITTAFTFIATAEAIKYVGAKPVFVDIDSKTFNIDPIAVKAAITEKTKAIMPVHLFGQPADITALQEICEHHDLQLIEDCAQSFGATVAGQQTGSFGQAAGFSFFPSKNLGAYGDGGLVATQCEATAAQIKKLRNHGSDVRYYHDVIGYNSRLDEMQAVVLRAKLKHIDEYNRRRREVAHRYSETLSSLSVTPPFEDKFGMHVYHQYTLLSEQRDAIMKALQDNAIACAVYYPVPLHQQSVFSDDCQNVSLPVTEMVSRQCFSLPICPELTDDQVDHICSVIASSLNA